MSESSGVFTFPETGIYLVRYNQTFHLAGDSAYNQCQIELTTNDSSYSTIAQGGDSIEQIGGSTTHAFASAEAMIDISNVSTHKVKFAVNTHASSTVRASSTQNDNSVTFIRLGDT
jgi:ATP-dependent protease HslVU (ClpYQ) peptidase subunit